MKAARWLVIGLVVFAAVLGVRTLSFESRQMELPPVALVDVNEEALAGQIAAGLRVPTISSRDPAQIDVAPFRQFRKLLAAQFPAMHGALESHYDDRGLLFRWPGTSTQRKPTLLMAHADVVPVQAETRERWSVDPFGGEVRSGFVWGRGALDNKGQLYLMCAAIERLVLAGFQPEQDLWFSFGFDEEVGGLRGNAALAQRFAAQGIRFEAVIDEGGTLVQGMMPGLEGPLAVIGIAEKGYLTVRLSVDGVGGHSSTPPRETTVAILAQALARVQGAPMPLRISEPVAQMLAFVGPEMPFGQKLAMANRWLFDPVLKRIFAAKDKTRATLHTTMAPTMLAAGVQENVLAKRAEATINFRVAPGDSHDSVIAHLRRVIDDARVNIAALDGFAAEASPAASTDSAIWRALQRSIHEIYPDATVAPYLMMAATDSRHFVPVADNVYRFMPYMLDADELDGIHGIDERIAIDSLEPGVNFYLRLFRNLSGGGDA